MRASSGGRRADRATTALIQPGVAPVRASRSEPRPEAAASNVRLAGSASRRALPTGFQAPAQKESRIMKTSQFLIGTAVIATLTMPFGSGAQAGPAPQP